MVMDENFKMEKRIHFMAFVNFMAFSKRKTDLMK